MALPIGSPAELTTAMFREDRAIGSISRLPAPANGLLSVSAVPERASAATAIDELRCYGCSLRIWREACGLATLASS